MNVDGYGERDDDGGKTDGWDDGWWCFNDWEPFIFVCKNCRGIGGWDDFWLLRDKEDLPERFFGW